MASRATQSRRGQGSTVGIRSSSRGTTVNPLAPSIKEVPSGMGDAPGVASQGVSAGLNPSKYNRGQGTPTSLTQPMVDSGPPSTASNRSLGQTLAGTKNYTSTQPISGGGGIVTPSTSANGSVYAINPLTGAKTNLKSTSPLLKNGSYIPYSDYQKRLTGKGLGVSGGRPITGIKGISTKSGTSVNDFYASDVYKNIQANGGMGTADMYTDKYGNSWGSGTIGKAYEAWVDSQGGQIGNLETLDDPYSNPNTIYDLGRGVYEYGDGRSATLNEFKQQEGTLDQAPTPDAVRGEATVPTAENAVIQEGATATTEFGTLTDNDKYTEIALKQYKGEQLTDEEVKWLIQQEITKGQEAGTALETAGQQILDKYGNLISTAEADMATTAEELAANTAAQTESYSDLIDKQMETYGQTLEEAMAMESQAVQAAASFSGFGRSTYNMENQAQVASKYADMLTTQKQANIIELERYRKELEGEDDAILAEMQTKIDDLKTQSMDAELELVTSVAELNAENEVSPSEAIANVMAMLPPQTKNSVDYDLTSAISDGYLYGLDKNGLPYRIQDSAGNEIKTGVNDTSESSIEFTAPKTDIYGNLVSPGYLFDKSTGTIKIVDPTTGQTYEIDATDSLVDDMTTYKNFDDYTSGIGNGNIVSGSPYHTGDAALSIDVDGSIGDPISSFVGGKVVKVEKSDTGYGNNVTVEDALGNQYIYAHLDSIAVNEGDYLSSGGYIGTMGNTGNTIPLGTGDGSHLHLEAHDKDGNALSLDDIGSSSTWSMPTYGTGVTNYANEAEEAGWADSKSDLDYYSYMKSIGVTLDPKTEDLDLTATQKQSLVDADSMLNMIDVLEQLAQDGVLEGTGLYQGSIGAFIDKYYGEGSEEAYTARSTLSNLMAIMAKARGGTSFTDTERELIEGYMPTNTESLSSILSKLETLKNNLDYIKKGIYTTAGYDSNTSAVDQQIGKAYGTDGTGKKIYLTDEQVQELKNNGQESYIQYE